MKRCAAFLTLLLLLASGAHGESAAEWQILQSFFDPNGVGNPLLVYTGEAAERFAKRPTIGETLPKGAIAAFRLLEETAGGAVYEVVVTTGTGTREWYAFFWRGTFDSKLAAVKTLNLPPYLFKTDADLTAQGTERSPEEESFYRRLQLVFMSSAELKNYFNSHLATFEELARLVENDSLEAAQAAAKQADLAAVLPYGVTLTEGELALLKSDARASGKQRMQPLLGTEIRLGGFFEGTIGLLHLPVGLAPPAMSPKDFIYVEPVGEGWYLFKNIAVIPPKTTKPQHK